MTAKESVTLVNALARRPKAWVDFMVRFELGLEAPDPKRAFSSALTIAAAYIVGGFIPLTPYLLIRRPQQTLQISVLFTITAIFAGGFVKGHFTGIPALRSALQTSTISGLAGPAAFLITKAIG